MGMEELGSCNDDENQPPTESTTHEPPKEAEATKEAPALKHIYCDAYMYIYIVLHTCIYTFTMVARNIKGTTTTTYYEDYKLRSSVYTAGCNLIKTEQYLIRECIDAK